MIPNIKLLYSKRNIEIIVVEYAKATSSEGCKKNIQSSNFSTIMMDLFETSLSINILLYCINSTNKINANFLNLLEAWKFMNFTDRVEQANLPLFSYKK